MVPKDILAVVKLVYSIVWRLRRFVLLWYDEASNQASCGQSLGYKYV